LRCNNNATTSAGYLELCDLAFFDHGGQMFEVLADARLLDMEVFWVVAVGDVAGDTLGQRPQTRSEVSVAKSFANGLEMVGLEWTTSMADCKTQRAKSVD
jgi:hypothetical protein